MVDYAKLESEQKERTVFENESFWAGVPYWAVWPFEIMIISKQHKRALVDFNDEEDVRLLNRWKQQVVRRAHKKLGIVEDGRSLRAH